MEGPIDEEITMRRKKIRTNNMKKKKNFLDRDNSIISGKVSPESRYLTTAGTINMSKGANLPDEHLNTKERARFLVELMSPFASRAGT